MEGKKMSEKSITEKKVAVVGIGGVGGYLAGMLGRACPHLTLAARGARRDSLLEKGINVEQKDVDAILYRFYHELADDATSSLQRDVRDGKRAEIDTFSGYIVREGKRLGLDMPVSEKMYEGLIKYEQKR